MNLKDKIVVVTGASRGLGKALAEAFLAGGADVVCSSRSPDSDFPCDVSDEKQVLALAEFALKKHGRIDIWVNNAGIWVPHGPAENLDFKRVHQMFEVNVFGVMYGCKAALVPMKRQKSGVIVNILSTGALDGRPYSSAYRSSKFAASGYTKCLNLEVEEENILVIGIYPGGMQTDLFDERQPEDFNRYMDPAVVAGKIIENLKKKSPDEELIIRR